MSRIVPASSTQKFLFTTNAATGAAVAPSSAFEAADVILYKDGSATQRSSTSGWTMTSPFDSIVGLHQIAYDLSDNTDAGFYADGSVYEQILSPDETVDSVAVVSKIDEFKIGTLPASIAVGNIANNAVTAAALATDAVTEIVSGLLNTINTGSTFNVNNSVGKQIRQGAGGTFSIRTGTCQAGSTSTTIKLDSGASATNNLYQGAKVIITGGTGVGQQRNIIAYSGSTKVATVDRAWVVTPDGTSTFELVSGTLAITSTEGTAQAGGASTITLATGAVATNSYYVPALVTILSGTGAGQTREITGYVGATRVATVDSAWSVQPDSTSVYAVIPSGGTTSDNAPAPPTASEIVGTLIASALSTTPTAGTVGEALAAARAQGMGKWLLSGTELTVYASDGTTPLVVFDLNSATAPTSRTPQ